MKGQNFDPYRKWSIYFNLSVPVVKKNGYKPFLKV